MNDAMSLYDETVPLCSKMLSNLDAWLDKAIAHAEAKGFDPEVLLDARLAPDMFTLRQQVQTACDQAKFVAARLTQQAPPKHEDTRQTISELRARIAEIRSYLGDFTPDDFEGADERLVPLFFAEGKALRGDDYAREWMLPNFYFHVGMAYALLRHNGVDLGKRDYIGSLSLRDLP